VGAGNIEMRIDEAETCTAFSPTRPITIH
jgi:hypothetical protein